MAITYSDATQRDAMAAATAAPNGGKRIAYLTVWRDALGSAPLLTLRREGVIVWSGGPAAALTLTDSALVMPLPVAQESIDDADIDTGAWTLTIANRANPSAVFITVTLTKTGGGGEALLSSDLVAGGTVDVGVIAITGPSLDSATATITKSDPRTVMWIDPNLTFAANTKPASGSSVYVQLTDAFKGRLYTSLPEPGVIGSGSDYLFARVADPDDGTKKSLFHQVRSTFPTWSGTYRSAYNSGADTVEGLKDGAVYWCCYEFKVSASMVTTAQPAGLFDIHHNNWDKSTEYDRPTFFGRAPIQILLQTDSKYRIDVFGNYDVGALAGTAKTEIVHTSPTLAAGDTHQFVFRFRVGRSWADQPFLQVWRRINGGATSQIVNRSDIELSYYDVPKDTHYLKPGLYQWVSSPSTMTMHTKGFQAFREAAGTPEIVPDVLFNLMDSL